ncbi:PQQ-binding-like beta-propeller repeat protein [Marivirga sp. S37H4]|uniref:PQQ-binding-like beta-propeller repeat protein n=1 Tax=Marivirga aurantiaca TaxID=2802615 RepID=A0A934X0G6_9BACT|nr:PQQ-binding-like beta-propeller repeat protein [Marivirga aurantiaca]MBK6266105.1 PQQ-binding-like beta-propeller repeat protein [Marivirga aurantiaca]
MSFLSSCSLFEDKDADKDSYQPLWEYNFNVGYFSSIDPIIHNDKVIFSALDKKKNDFSANSTLEAFDKNNGKLIWKWDGTIDNSYGQFNYQAENVVNRNIFFGYTGIYYAVDLDFGVTTHYAAKAESDGFGGAFLNLINESLLVASFSSVDNKKTELKSTSLNSFSWEPIMTLNNDDSLSYHMRFAKAYDDGTILLPINIGKQDFSIGRIMLTQFDLQIKQFTRSKVIEIDYSYNRFLDDPPQENDESIFLSIHGAIVSIDKDSFDTNWEISLDGNASRSGFCLVNDYSLFINTEFSLYAIDTKKGNVLWQVPSRAGSRLRYHNGVIYYTGGTKLRAVDATSGESLMAIEAPSFSKDGGAFFQPVMNIDHENNRIYTASYTHAYCYPTLR